MVKKPKFSPIFFFSVLAVIFAFLLLEITIYRQVHQEAYTSSLHLSPRPTPTPTRPKSKMCGGIANLPCPSGYQCLVTQKYPDASGTCVQQLTKQFTFIKKIYLKNGQYYIDADYAEMLADNTAPDGYRISNTNPQIRSLKLSSSVEVLPIVQSPAGVLNRQVSLVDFIDNFTDSSIEKFYGPLNMVPYWLYLDSQNQVVKIEQQYIP